MKECEGINKKHIYITDRHIQTAVWWKPGEECARVCGDGKSGEGEDLCNSVNDKKELNN